MNQPETRINVRIFRPCLGCPGPHAMELPLSVIRRLLEQVTCATCPNQQAVDYQTRLDTRGSDLIVTQERLDQALSEAGPNQLSLLEVMR